MNQLAQPGTAWHIGNPIRLEVQTVQEKSLSTMDADERFRRLQVRVRHQQLRMAR